MIRIFSNNTSLPLHRREMLQIGSVMLGGLGLPQILAAKSVAPSAVRQRSVVVLNLQGGPTQYELFDPNMQAADGIRSITGEVATGIAGVTFGGTIPQLASHADKMAIVRSYRHGISSHGPAAMHVMAGGNATGAMMGSLFSRVAGLTHPGTGVPHNVLITSRAMGSQYKDLYYNSDRVSQIGSLPAAYKSFDPSAGGQLVQDMSLHVDARRLDDRRALLKQLDHLRRRSEMSGLELADRFQQQAFDVLSRGVADAFDLSKEDPRTLERYSTASMEPPDSVKARNAYAKQFSPVALGKQMLLARRLCQAGAGFITVTCPGWDMHGGGKEFTMADGIASLTPALDKAVSAFVEDIERLNMWDDVLLVITGEFGRTPKINKNGGRDHWGNLCTLAFLGGGMPMGQVIGQSDQTGAKPASEPISSGNVLATIMHALLDIGQVRVMSELPIDVVRELTGSSPIRELV